MSLRSTFGEYLKGLFQFADSIQDQVVYTSVSTTRGYNTSTGAVTAATTVYRFPVLFSGYRDEEINGTDILAGDRRGLVRRDQLPVLPTQADSLVDGDGLTWNLVRWKLDPTKTGFLLQLRRP